MIHGIGVDLVDLPRFERLVAANGERFVRRWFTSAELGACETAVAPAAAYAARLAGKEAVWKALGVSGLGRVPWRSIEIVGDPGSGNGTAYLIGDHADWARLPALQIAVSWATIEKAVVAVAIAELTAAAQA